jgi:hypothetical protein
MRDKTWINREIEERLGSEGSPQMAAQMFEALEAVGAIEFVPDFGFRFVGEDRESREFKAWDAALNYVTGGTL